MAIKLVYEGWVMVALPARMSHEKRPCIFIDPA